MIFQSAKNHPEIRLKPPKGVMGPRNFKFIFNHL
ncbi:MAG: hypothetical protein ACI90Q_002390, partial [Nonlabens sp.]